MIRNDLLGYQYAKRVVEGNEIANKYIILECKRYLNRLENADDEIYFDYKEAEIIYQLLELVNYSTGFYAGEPVIRHLAGFQAMFLENVFCWFYKDDSCGHKKRVIEEVYLEIGRKSGKSFLCALTEIIIMLRADEYSQTACAGKIRDISSLVRNMVVELINSSPYIKKHFKITRECITCKLNNCTLKALSGEADNINGRLLSSYIVDEVANMSDSSVIDALKLSQMSTKTRLAIYISTQYANPQNVFNELINYHKKILKGELKVRNTFGLLFEMDEGDNYEDERNWYKASPLQMSLEDGRQFLRGEFNKGKSVPSAMREFRIKILNEQLVERTESYIDMKDYKKCVVDNTPFDINGATCFIGIDISKIIDTTGVSFVFPYMDNGVLKQYVEVYNFLPNEDSLIEHSKTDKIDYLACRDRGEIITTNNVIIDQQFVINFCLEKISKYNLKVGGFCVDPHNSSLFVTEIEKQGFEVFIIYQSAKHISEPIETLKGQIKEQRVLFKKNQFLEWQFSNCKVITDTQGYSRLDKFSQKCNRIDGVASTLDALKLSFYYKPPKDLNEYILSDDFFV